MPLSVLRALQVVLLLSVAFDATADGVANIDTAAIAQPNITDWPSYGRDHREQRFSALDQINVDTVAKLGAETRSAAHL